MKRKSPNWSSKYSRGSRSIIFTSSSFRAVTRYSKKWLDVAKFVGRSQEDCRLRWRDHEGLGRDGSAGYWKEEETSLLHRAVHAACEESGISFEDTEDNSLPWTLVSAKYNTIRAGTSFGARSANQCLLKW